MMGLITRDATAQLAGLRGGTLSATSLFEAELARIDALNPGINALIEIDREAGYRQAAASDARLAAGTARPLEGLPVSIKDCFDVAGLGNRAGASLFASYRPAEDAVAVARLRAAGAVIFAKSNVPAFAGDFQTYNKLFGTTNAPFDPARSPGGSSGGAAAAIASAMSALELGSDIGGSIRWPAHCCGIYGLKPTWDLVPTFGHVPPAPGLRLRQAADMVVAGPLARSARDLDLALKIIASPLNAEGPAFLPPPRCEEPQGLRLALWADDPFAPVDATVRAGVAGAAGLLMRAGAQVDDQARPASDFAELYEAYALLLHAITAAGLPEAARQRLITAAAQYGPHDRSHAALQARGARLNADDYALVQSRRQAARAAFASFFERFDALLVPPAPTRAIPHDHSADVMARLITVNGATRPYFDVTHWAAFATFCGLPACVAPLPVPADGMPTGVQIICAAGQDRQAIAIAGMLGRLQAPA
ncbi:MAG: amidase [Hyphomicrobiales bacterium]|nr:amidase [Hyphomicrobiales bacterium]